MAFMSFSQSHFYSDILEDQVTNRHVESMRYNDQSYLQMDRKLGKSRRTDVQNENSMPANTFTDTLRTIAIKYMRAYPRRNNKVFSLLTNSSAGKNNSC